MAQTVKASVVLASAWGAAAVASGGRSFLAHTGGMRPDLVAASLVHVEDDWAAQATAFLDCSASDEAGLNCDIPGKAFEKSCGTIVSAVVQASSGDRDRVLEYMNDVCREKALDRSHKARCQSLMAFMVQHMSPDSYANRETWDSSPMCASFWERVKAQEKHSIEDRRAEEAKAQAASQKAEMEEAKLRQAAEDASIAAASKTAEEAAKAEQEADAAAKAVEESMRKQIQAVVAASVASSNKTAGAAKSEEDRVLSVEEKEEEEEEAIVKRVSIAKDSEMKAKVEPKFANATPGNATTAAVQPKALPQHAKEVVNATKAK